MRGLDAAFTDHEETDISSATNADIALESLTKKRKIVAMAPGTQPGVIDHKVVPYSENLREGKAGKPKALTLLDRIKQTVTGRSEPVTSARRPRRVPMKKRRHRPAPPLQGPSGSGR